MGINLSNKLNKFTNYSFDMQELKIKNLRDKDNTDIDEFLEIVTVLDSAYLKYQITTDFEIYLLNNKY